MQQQRSRSRNSLSPRHRTPPYDSSRTPPRGPAAEMRLNTRDWDRRKDRGPYSDNTSYRGRPSSPRRGGRKTYRDRDQEGYQSPVYESYSRSRSRSPRRDRSPHYSGPPSREIIMEGLPIGMTEDDISRELKQYHNIEGLEDVRVIRDRQTRVSRQFGFLRFATLHNSRSFLERNHPMIYLYGNSVVGEGEDEGTKVRISFSREREDRGRTERQEGEWICKICSVLNYPGRIRCFRCQSVKTDAMASGSSLPAVPAQLSNNGDSDISPDNTPSQFLLVRGLEPTVTEEVLAKGVSKLYKPDAAAAAASNATAAKKSGAKVASTTGDANLGAKEGSLRRVLLIRDRRSNDSWRYGFAEFQTVDDAQAALTRFNSFDKFTISSKPVLVSYIHAGVFVPVFNPTPSIERFLFSPLSNDTLKLQYWDESAYVTELRLAQSGNTSPQEKDGSTNATANEKAKDGLKATKANDSKSKKRKADIGATLSSKKSAPAQLQFWSNRHAELHGLDVKDSKKGDVEQDNKTEAPNVKEADEIEIQTQSYADPERNCCYLCSRQFKSSAEVNKHERLSKLHQDNLNNEELKSKAMARLKKLGHAVQSASMSEYRDRAKERRQAFGSSKRTPLPGKPKAVSEEKEAAPPPSKGASLLSKMGWSSGAGLGAQGTGMTAPIQQDLYVAGVGLGAEGGKVGDAAEEASRNTGGSYAAFLEKAKDKAKERFQQMS